MPTKPYKAALGFVLTAAGLIVQALVGKGDSAITAREWVVIIVGSLVTSAGVWGITNPPKGPRVRDERGASDLVIAICAVAIIATVLIAAGVVKVNAATPVQPARPYWVDRACPAEDSVNCFWDAEQRGDGQGHSFIVRQVPNSNGLVCVFFTELEYAKTHDFCAR